MERETELTQSWNSEVAAMKVEMGGLLKGIPLLIGGEMRTFSLPPPLDDDGTDISLKDWQVNTQHALDRETTAVYPIKPFKGSVRTRFTPMEPRLDEDLSPRSHSSAEHFDTPTTPRTPRGSSSGTRSSSVSPTNSLLQREPHNSGNSSSSSLVDEITPADDSSRNGDPRQRQRIVPVSPRTPGVAFDVILDEMNGNDNSNLRSRSERGSSLRVSFVDEADVAPQPRPSPLPKVRHRSPLKSRSLNPPKEVKALQPKWESSTKIRPQTSPATPRTPVQAPLHGVRPRKGASAAKPRPQPPPPEIESNFHSNGYSSGRDIGSDRHSGRQISTRRSVDSQSAGDRGRYDSSNWSSREHVLSPTESGREDTASLKPNSPDHHLTRSNDRGQRGGREPDHDEDENTKGMLCGVGISDTKLSSEFVRLLSKLCRVSVPAPKQQLSKSAPPQSGRKFERSHSASLAWDTNSTPARENLTVIGRHDSLKLLSERCSTGPEPAYNLAQHKPRKIRNHEPHIHIYKTISKTLDRKLRS